MNVPPFSPDDPLPPFYADQGAVSDDLRALKREPARLAGRRALSGRLMPSEGAMRGRRERLE